MKEPKKRVDPLISYIMAHLCAKCTQEQAEAWADKHCGDWRNTPLPKAKRIESISSNEKEWEE
ncbi:hypothetical protein M2H05_15180 [Vibrio vulnificus]|nr:hypothetical protein [Vibrio vulnificus]RZQ00648.1 hypothetical protein D8T54_02880 [Vibrio vulnificus]RZQ46813.1 hypothetical protein D8T55_04580 [Vibrio vulnificus]